MPLPAVPEVTNQEQPADIENSFVESREQTSFRRRPNIHIYCYMSYVREILFSMILFPKFTSHLSLHFFEVGSIFYFIFFIYLWGSYRIVHLF